MAGRRLVPAVLLLLCAALASGARKPIHCHWAEWSIWRGEGAFQASDIDPNLCDVIVYSYVGLNQTNSEIESISAYSDYENQGIGNIALLVELKQANENLKIMVSIGGWNQASLRFSKMAKSPEKRKIFVDSVVNYLKMHQLDGLDIAWEYPASRGGIPDDKKNYPILLQELKKAFSKEGWLLTVQLFGQRQVMERGYDLAGIAAAVDHISIVGYQYHIPQSHLTGHHAPLRSRGELNVQWSVDYLLQNGVNPDKILLGFSTYGHQYLMDDPLPTTNFLGVRATKTYPSFWSQEPGYIGFNEVCIELKDSDWQEYWDDKALVPYAVNGNKFMSYENKESYQHKLLLLQQKKLGGAMVWSIDTDDFRGSCYISKYPLIGEIKSFFTNLESGQSFAFTNKVILEELPGLNS